MKSLEYLMNIYPDKTAREILNIQEEEKLIDQKENEKHNEKNLAFIKDINENGGYYRGKFGLDQYYYYRVFNLRIEVNHVYADIESIVLFVNNDNYQNVVIKPNEIRLEKRLKEYCYLGDYNLENEERVTIEEWNYINNYLDNMSSLFW